MTGRGTVETEISAALERARTHSPFLRFHIERGGPLIDALATGQVDRAMELARAAGEGLEPAKSLRAERTAYAVALAVIDLAQVFPFERVVGELSDLADRLIDRAIRAALLERMPDEEPRGFAALGLGKLGGRELNYSSDVDLIYLYDPDTLPRRPREEPDQAAVRVGQRVLELLQKRTEDGYAFRVDLRLRPSPEVTPISLPVEAAISYYESAALGWERAAFIRSRHVGGDVALGQGFLHAIHPFIWRRSIDFGAIDEIQAMSGQIRDHYASGQGFGPGFDLKRGRGGIREVEFYAQAHQLIHGGRDPALRPANTLEALAALAAGGRIDPQDADRLSTAYRQLRTIEHRTQMVDDRQTHQLPLNPDALDNVAQLHGAKDGQALLDLLEPTVTTVAGIYDGLARQHDNTLPRAPDQLGGAIDELGFADASAVAQRIEGWRSGKYRSLRSPAARAAFEAMLPDLLAALSKAPDPIQAFNRFDRLVERLPSGVNFFRLIEARPALSTMLAAILSHAPALADQLGTRPALFDGLIDASAFDPPPDVDTLAAEFAASDRPDDDYQLLLDRVRARVNGARFALGCQIVLAKADPLEVGRGYGRVAEAAIRVLTDATLKEFETKHGRVPGGDLVIIALGRMGGGVLTHASDLDLIYLFTGDFRTESVGAKPLHATDYFNRLAPRVTAALSVPTAAGPLYEVDLRMRPSGKDGLHAVSIESFADYQRDKAWTFEHMAMTRARPVYGPPEGRAEIAAVLDTIRRMPRDAAKTAADVVKMRDEIARHKPPSGPFDIKLAPGGLVDLEFLVQGQQLIRGETMAPAMLDPDLDTVIPALEEAGIVPAGLADAHRLLTRMLVTLRLVSPDSAEPPAASRDLVAAACGYPDWDSLLAAYAGARHRIRDGWARFSATARDEGE